MLQGSNDRLSTGALRPTIALILCLVHKYAEAARRPVNSDVMRFTDD
jgi:hypothetical protein